MKKIILAAVTIITMMLCMASPMFVQPIKANAAVGVSGETIETTEFIPLSDLIDYYGSDVCYVYMAATYSSSGSYTFFFVFDEATSIETDSNGYAINISGATLNGGSAKLYYRQLYVNRSDNYYRIDSLTEFSCSYLRINSDYSSFVVNDISSSNLTTIAFDSKLEASLPSLNVSVNFYPDLIGNVDRKIDGVTSEDFKIEIINHSLRTNVQCLMVICPTGQNVSFYDRTDYTQDSSISSVVSYNSLYTYLWWSDEWNYNYTSDIQTHFMHDHHPVASETFDVEKSLGPCPWHYVPADGIVRHSFAWSQINLEKFKSYTVYVYAMALDDEVASRQAAFPTAPHFVDYDTIECVYSSEFTITNGYVYDQNNTAHGNYRSFGNGSSDSQMLGWSSKGTMDSNGNINIQSKTLQDYLDKHQEKMSNYTEAYIAPNWDGTSKVNVSSSGVSTVTTNYFDKFMMFVSYVFGRFPPSVQEIYIFGFVSVVVLGIILKVIK